VSEFFRLGTAQIEGKTNLYHDKKGNLHAIKTGMKTAFSATKKDAAAIRQSSNTAVTTPKHLCIP